MVASLVLTLLIAAIIAIISYNYNTTSLDRTKTQAYYTAQTVNERIVNWLSGTPSPDTALDPTSSNYEAVKDPYNFVRDLIADWDTPEVQSYTEEELGPGMGTATTTVEFTTNRFDEIQITTTAEYAGVSETLSTLMHLQRMSDFNTINTGFDYSDPGISEALADVQDISTWSAQAAWAIQCDSADAAVDGGNGAGTGVDTDVGWWSYFLNVYRDGIVDYRMDLLAVSPGDYTENPSSLRHDYSYRYLLDSGFASGVGKDLVRIGLDPSRGAFFLNQTYESPVSGIPAVAVGSSDNPVINSFPYNNTALRPTVKGVLLSMADEGPDAVTALKSAKVVYYTLDHAGFDSANWPDITLGTSYGSGSTPPSTPFIWKDLSIYLSDTSEKAFEINSGITVTSGTLYTRRNANIGTVFNDTGNSNNAVMNNYTKTTPLVFDAYNFIFADPGQDATQRHSTLAGTAYYDANGTARTTVDNANILIQNNHELTIGAGATINTRYNKGIIIEPGGSVVIEAGCDITGNIYVSSGATLTIQGEATIRGNIFCAGILNINGSFVLNNFDEHPDNIALGHVTYQNNNAAGIFIYNDTNIGVGTLNISGNPVILSNYGTPPNGIHTFVPAPGYPSSLFCDHANADTHVCGQWESNAYVWTQRPGSTQAVYEEGG